jgi:glutamate-1-semialdehyde aminotransferase
MEETIMEVLKRSLKKSNEYWERATKVIMDGTQLYSKGPKINVQGVSPIYLQRGKGCHVWDVDGTEYIDYGMAVGTLILGYNYSAINTAIKKQLNQGTNFSLVHPKEVELAELLSKYIPCAEKMRFEKTGSSATTAAIRLARAYTGREKVIKGEYHGWHDWCIANSKHNLGIPKILQEYVFTGKYNDLESYKILFEQHGDDIAAVITELIEFEEPKDNFISNLKVLAHKYGALIIFDEIVTGFRFALGGGQEYFNVVPDIATFGKAMSNGMPISAVAGKAEVFDKVHDHVFISTTFGGECLSLAAAIATITELHDKKVPAYLWKIGKKLKNNFNTRISEHELQDYIQCVGLPPRLNLSFKASNAITAIELKSLGMQEMVKRGILFTWTIFTSYSLHDTDIEKTMEAFDDSLKVCKRAIVDNDAKKYLEGKPIVPIL